MPTLAEEGFWGSPELTLVDVNGLQWDDVVFEKWVKCMLVRNFRIGDEAALHQVFLRGVIIPNALMKKEL